MKRCIWIFIICAILTSICTAEQLMVNGTLKRLNEYSNNLYLLSTESESVNTEDIYNLSKELSDYWNKQEHMLCFFINYKDMNEMSNEIIKIVSYSKNNIKEEFTTSLALLQYYCDTFDHITGFNLQNIF